MLNTAANFIDITNAIFSEMKEMNDPLRKKDIKLFLSYYHNQLFESHLRSLKCKLFNLLTPTHALPPLGYLGLLTPTIKATAALDALLLETKIAICSFKAKLAVAGLVVLV
jgi:hypothetical protein